MTSRRCNRIDSLPLSGGGGRGELELGRGPFRAVVGGVEVAAVLPHRSGHGLDDDGTARRSTLVPTETVPIRSAARSPEQPDYFWEVLLLAGAPGWEG